MPYLFWIRWSVSAALFISVGATTLSSQAQTTTPSVIELKPVVVTASRAPRTLGEEIADISVITREEIDRAGQQSLADLLQQQAGVELSRNGGAGTLTSVFLRGTNSNHVVLLVDGVRINSLTSGGASWQAIPLAEIERIEILRGPASGLYGADAIGGVVQVFTRQGKQGLAGEMAIGYGSDHFNSQRVSVRGGSGGLRYSLSAGQESSHGDTAKTRLVADQDRDGYRMKNGALMLGYTFNAEHEMTLQLLENRLKSQFDTGSVFDDRSILDQKIYALTSKNRFAKNWLSTVRVAQSRDEYSERASYGNSFADSHQNQLTWQNDIALGDDLLQLSLERKKEWVYSDTNYNLKERRTNSVVGLYQLNRGQHSAQFNLRSDESNQYGNKLTGGIGYVYRVTQHWRVSASVANAFHAPTFNDLYYPGFSNPNFKPERARNAEAGVAYAAGKNNLSLVVYRNRIRDMIDGSALVNRDRVNIEGVSLRGGSAMDRLNLRGSLDWQSAKDQQTHLQLTRRARRHGSVQLDYQWDRAGVGAEWLFSGRRVDTTGFPATRVTLHGYGVMNLFATYRFAKDWELLARWNNVFDKRYELVRDYSTPRSNGFVGVRYQFGQ